MSWNDADPADALDDDIGVAAAAAAEGSQAQGSQATAAEGSQATAAEGSQATAAADAEAAAEDAPNDEPSIASEPHGGGDMEPAGEPHGGGEDAPHGGGGDGAEKCAICQGILSEDPDDSLREAPELAILPCFHKFHKVCIDETCRVMNRTQSALECPTCRKTPQDIRSLEERVISEGLARRVADGLPARAKAAQQARQLQLDVMFGVPVAGTAKVHWQRCAGLINL